MTKTEIATLRAIAGNLRGSARVSWTEGGLEKWAEWAKDMRNQIRSNASLIDALIEGTDLDLKSDDELTLN